jgi:isopenicillin-N N-acyltransferase-like protein
MGPIMLELPSITIAGSPRAMGQALGEALREPIQAFVDQRLRAARAYLFARRSRDFDGLLAAGAACLALTADWDPPGAEEHAATAAAAGVDPVALFTTANMTDVRDVHLFHRAAQTQQVDAEGCTALFLDPGHSAEGLLIAAQTWDLNPPDLDYIGAVHRRPSEGPETWSVTCSGCQTLVGMNAEGVWVGTTNIKTVDARPGVPYLSLLHRAIRCSDHAAAATLIAEAPRAGAHSYWLADATGAVTLECSARRHVSRRLAQEPLVQTNHCLDPEHVALEGEPPASSTRTRFGRASSRAAAGQHDVASLQALFADRSDGVDSINRYPEDEQGTATNACLIGIPARRELHACKGPSDRGRWVQLAFD